MTALPMALTVLCLSGIAIAGCEGVGPPFGVQGSGHVRTETRDVRGFDRVTVDGTGTLVITQGTDEHLSITAEDNILPHLASDVAGSRLTLGPRQSNLLNPTRPIRYELGVKQLHEVTMRGSGDMETASLDTDKLDITVSGSGSASLARLTAASLSVTENGSGSVTVDGGQATAQTVTIRGSGRYRAAGLQSRNATIEVAGSGDCAVRVSDNLNVTITGSGRVTYSGSPSLNENIFGSGKVTRAG